MYTLGQESKQAMRHQKIANTTNEQMTEIDVILSIMTLCVKSPNSTIERHRQTKLASKETTNTALE